MKRKPPPRALVTAFQSSAHGMRGIEERKMFGYPALFVNGRMFAGLVRDRMVLRLADRDRECFLELPNAQPFIAMGRSMKQWVVVPPTLLKSKAELRKWLGKALANGRKLPPKRPTGKRVTEKIG
jgi:TfoX/Sxy family transcriptional regulator of competence genes